MRLRQIALTVLVFASVAARVDAVTASRLYEQGDYEEALEQYKKAVERDADNWPLHYNLGAAAYKSGHLDEAAKAFERAIGSADKQLQATSFYNLGNSYFRLGQGAEHQSPQQALPLYERSLKGYESALAVEPNDDDARHNLEVVKKKIEELKKQKQQQQQEQQQNPQDKKQDQKNDTQQEQEKAESSSSEENQEQSQQDQAQNQDQAKQQQQQKAEQEAKKEKQESQQPQTSQPIDFDRAQAAALLDNLREDERNWNFFPELQMNLKDSGEPAKDW